MAASRKRWMRTTAKGRYRPRVTMVSSTLTTCRRAKARADMALVMVMPGKLVFDQVRLAILAVM